MDIVKVVLSGGQEILTAMSREEATHVYPDWVAIYEPEDDDQYHEWVAQYYVNIAND